jgi:thiol-disulfide isomerase/thioredoxin
MPSIKTILTTFFFISTISLARSASFYIKIEDPSVFQLDCSLKNAKDEPIGYHVKLKNPSGDAYFAFDVTTPQIVRFQYQNTVFNLFIEPDNDISIFFKANAIQHTLRFEGVGAENNNCIAQFNKNFRSDKKGNWFTDYFKPDIDAVTESRARGLDSETYLSIVKGEKEAELDFLSPWKERINKQLYSYIWKDVVYTNDTKLYAYFLLNDYLSKEEMRQAWVKLFSNQGFNYTDYERNETPVFINALKTYIHSQLAIAKYETDAKTLYDVIGNKLNGYDKFYCQKELILEVFNKTKEASLAKQKFEAFSKDCPFKDLTKSLQFFLDSQLDILTSEQAPDLELDQENGFVTHLSAFRGRVVYVSFWASWCKPCIENFQKYADMRLKLQNEGIVLLNVNIDDDVSKYRAASAKLALSGINVQPLDMAKAKQLYNVYSIPAYFIVDKNGNFATLPNKEGRDIVEEFKKIVKSEK